MTKGLSGNQQQWSFTTVNHCPSLHFSSNSQQIATVLAAVRPQKSLLLLCGIIALITLIAAAPTLAAAPQSTELSIAEDRFTAGERLTISDPIAGDLVSAGGEIEITADVAGDLLAFGGQIQMAGKAMQDVYMGGGQVTIVDSIAHNARIAGGEVRLESGAKIGGNASIAGGNLDLAGDIGGYLIAAGGTIFIDGVIDGDVRLAGETIQLGPNTHIQGRLLYTSENELQQDPAALIGGGIDRLPWSQQPHKGDTRHFDAGYGIWTLGLALLAVIVLALLPNFSGKVSDTLRRQPGLSLLLGLALLLCTPIAIVLATITAVGLPVALLLLMTYLTAVLVGYVFAGIALGDIVLQRFKPEQASPNISRMFGAALAIVVFSLLALLPFLGGLLVLLVLLAGMGALMLGIKAKYVID